MNMRILLAKDASLLISISRGINTLSIVTVRVILPIDSVTLSHRDGEMVTVNSFVFGFGRMCTQNCSIKSLVSLMVVLFSALYVVVINLISGFGGTIRSIFWRELDSASLLGIGGLPRGSLQGAYIALPSIFAPSNEIDFIRSGLSDGLNDRTSTFKSGAALPATSTVTDSVGSFCSILSNLFRIVAIAVMAVTAAVIPAKVRPKRTAMSIFPSLCIGFCFAPQIIPTGEPLFSEVK